MSSIKFTRHGLRVNAKLIVEFLVLPLAIFVCAKPVQAQPSQESTEFSTLLSVAFVPQEGQAGKDVVWLPTSQTLVERMLDMAKVTANDFLIDLGSGDGRTVIAAAKRGVRALGIEYDANMVELSRRNAEQAGVSHLVTFKQADLFECDFSEADVITMFLLPEINLALRPKLLQLRPGTRIVSNTFHMDEWDSDESSVVTEGCTDFCKALMWIVPAQTQGVWRIPQGELDLRQSFQVIYGTLRTQEADLPIKYGKISGFNFAFTAGDLEYSGRLSGDSIEDLTTKPRTTPKFTRRSP